MDFLPIATPEQQEIERAKARKICVNANQYQADARRTLAPNWHGENVSAHELLAEFNNLIVAASNLDRIKKALFYGRNADYQGLNALGGKADWAEHDQYVLHALIGMATEVGELLEAWTYAFTNNKLHDVVNLAEEGGDVAWYLATLATGLQIPLQGILNQNIAKLSARFPDKFTEEAANNRDLANERNVLEQNQPTNG